MSYVFFGGMRGTAWVNTFQTILFLMFGADRGQRDRRRDGRIRAGDRVAAGVAVDGAAAHARARLAAVFLQLHVHPALVDRVSAHRHLLPDGAPARPLQEDRRPVSAVHAARSGCRRCFSAWRRTPRGTCRRSRRSSRRGARSRPPGRRSPPAERDRLRAQAGGRRRDSPAGRRLRAAVAGGAARRVRHGGGDGQRFADPRAVDDVHRRRVRLLRRQGPLRRGGPGARPAACSSC